MKKRSKIILFVLLGFLIAGVATFAAVSAYWVSNISNPANKKDDVQIAVGEGKAVTTKIDLTKSALNANEVLVPQNQAAHSKTDGGKTPVEQIQMTVSIKWLEDGSNQVKPLDNVTGQCTLKVKNIKVGSQTDVAHYVKVKIGTQNGLTGETKQITLADPANTTFTITVTIDEPSKQDYEKLAGKQITFEIEASIVKD